MTKEELKQSIRLALTENPDKVITPAELEEALMAIIDNRADILQDLQYFDDGTGEVVPVKHPDLSTQPSILPYKFAGNYVYEQMVFVTSAQSNNDSVTLIRFSDFGLKDGKKILLDYSICQMGDEGGFIDIYGTLPFRIVAKNDKIVLDRVSGTETPDMWIRVVWTDVPTGGIYYYSRNKYNLYINTPQDYPLSLHFGGNTFSMIEGKVPDAIVERFITEGTLGIVIQPEDLSQMKKYIIHCSETREVHSLTATSPLLFVYSHETYEGVVSLEYLFPQAAERLKKGGKTTLDVNIQYE